MIDFSWVVLQRYEALECGGPALASKVRGPLFMVYLRLRSVIYAWLLGYSLGGDAYWASGLHLFVPLPFVKNEVLRRIKMHSFATAGNLVQCCM